MNARAWKIAPLLFGSGLCALVYQTAWQRELRLIFGASTAASAAVLAIFMAGLGLGGALLGPRADKHRRPLELYGNLEGLIALSAAATPVLVWLAREVYVALGGTVALGMAGGSVVRLVLSALLLAVPTLLMGGTLPAVARAAETTGDVRRRALAVLYGVNTLGAVAGAALSTFFLFEVFGTQQTLWLACLLNGLIAMAARVMSRSMPEQEASSAAAEPAPEAEPARFAPPPRTFVLAAAAAVGFAFLLMELVWYRMLSPLLGGSTFTFGLILIIALLGIGLGGGAYAAWGRDRPATVRGFALTCLAEALFIAVPYALGDRVAVFAMMLRSLEGFGFIGLVMSWSAVAALVILPAAFISGVQFPLLLALLGRGRENVGKEVGLAYAWNTVGAIIGSLAGGFGVMPLLTAPGTWRLVVGLLLVLGAAALVLALLRERQVGRLWLPAVAGALAVMMLMAPGPSAAWRHNPIGAGRARLERPTFNRLREWASTPQRELMLEFEGVESSVGVLVKDGSAFYVNGKSDGNSIGDASTQVMSGMVGMLLHPQPRQALVIGLGTGSSAGWIGAVPDVERVDVVEIEPAILKFAEHAAPVNMNVMSNPKVHTFIGDAREVLLASKQRYDIILSEPSNPYRAGISSLFTQDFYQAVRQRMAPGGIFIQWLQAYEIDATTVRSAYATLASEFPAVETWQTNGGDLLLVATEAPIVYDADRMRARLAQEPFRKAALVAWSTDELEGVLAHYIGSDALARKLAEGHEAFINTDDLSFMEFAIARTVGRSESSKIPAMLRTGALSLQASQPALSRGAVDWARVEVQRVTVATATRGVLLTQPQNPDRATVGHQEFIKLVQRGDFPAAVSKWREGGWQPKGLLELTWVSQALAQTGDEAALPFIEQLRPLAAMEAEALLGVLRLRQGRWTEAAGAFEQAYVWLSKEPWGQRTVTALLLEATQELARKERSLGLRLYAHLEQPFAGYALQAERQRVRVNLARRLDWGGLCQKALEPYQEHPLWRQRFLADRYECYEHHKDPLREQAMASLSAFLVDEPPLLWEGEMAGPGGQRQEEPEAPASASSQDSGP
ncbi:fused MFS/spermidine synthase [Hyalangium rubrum]|uniref:Fused MFS/spermidine synthase n=1 Tax=Hyalangium rubrum TaxID=3103134 RepID=A0ABU5H0A4_9BACT|nr:fused MFS/spermidine synthase [Hyalangium sp. s54d21]MDY7226877.1 fused MFS/spermidine synthase [Hyalangium sp. s54d21]